MLLNILSHILELFFCLDLSGYLHLLTLSIPILLGWDIILVDDLDFLLADVFGGHPLDQPHLDFLNDLENLFLVPDVMPHLFVEPQLN